MKRLFSRFFIVATLLSAPVAVQGEPQWIWSSKDALPEEKAVFRKKFTVASPIKSATLTVTCDNVATAALNGAVVAESRDWKTPGKADVRGSLKVGENELRIEAQNAEGVAALIVVIKIKTTDGKDQTVETAADWEVLPADGGEPKKAVVIAKYGDAPWGAVFEAPAPSTAGKGKTERPLDASAITVPPGFAVELLYSVPKDEQGSWITMTVDPRGRLITCDQDGGLYRITIPPVGQKGEPVVEALKTDISGAHGLLYAWDSLYVMVNEKKGEQGLWRLRDLDGDDQFENAELLRRCDGSGEHGPHGLALSPDGQSIYFASGNHTKLPDHMELSRAAWAWDEDQLLPRLWDANGHAKGILAPGGHICKTDPDGKVVELVTAGFRNQYDLAFDANGELFTFDSDMEWDIGTPWYRPTRIAHCTSGSEFGWRSGAGKWPDYYPDSLPPAFDVGPGSPTGTVFGTGAKFPAKYQRALFAMDWTYGTMYAIHMVPEGASFRAEKEEFVAGKPLPLADVIVHPGDGAMYFLIGGRKTQSALYRVSYLGQEAIAPAPPAEPTAQAKLRRSLEELHVDGTGPEAIAKAWPYLSHGDRFVRFAARVAIERQPVQQWAERAFEERNPQAAIEALIALARVGEKGLQPRLLEALSGMDLATVDPTLRLALLRAWQLAFIRMGKPAPEVAATVAARFDRVFPHPDALMNRELVQLLVFLDSPTVAARTVPLLSTSRDDPEALGSDTLLDRNTEYATAAREMYASRPNRQAIAYAYALRNARVGWTPELRKAFFNWFPRTRSWKGGNSFTKFIDNIRTEALENAVADAGERASLDTLSKVAPSAAPVDLAMPEGPGKAYTVDEVIALAHDGLKGRNFDRGKAMFASMACLACHHFKGEGGNVGPDLTGSGNRYNLRDLLENIVEPSKVISDQYGSEEIELEGGSVVIGRALVEENGKLFVMASPFAPDELAAIPSGEVKSRKPYPVSMMPPGLINPLNPGELLDLLAYIQSGGDPDDKAFRK